MKIGIIGANGSIGQRLGKILTVRGEEVLGFIRKKEQAEKLESLGVASKLEPVRLPSDRQ